ncbi:hypothetical protein EIP91_006764 [Steccherinum ochraceum]|uniref:FAD-binding domain-containing protein n=1 Tax=Steccherinum ochraceum TaxID=92696 RepID=A0A4V2MVL0_9APHY|nr:hypothetical protein EIP91_006764 [Steccherinum ochraceum]
MSVPDRPTLPPQHAQVLIIGGGPGGSIAASALAREGLDVVVLEMAQFPRYHIGESLIPSARHFLRFVGAEEKVINHGFLRKPGSAIKLNQYMQEGYTDFTALGEINSVWNVKRSEFDHLLLNHAEECGAAVFQQCRVLSLNFAQDEAGGDRAETHPSEQSSEQGRPVSATYMMASGEKGEISFDFLVDASGRAGVMSTKYLKNRHYNSSLKNVAVWGYWRGCGIYGTGSPRENAPFFEALSDESGWAWFIPLTNGLTSVGIVMDQKQMGMRSRACSSAASSTQGGSTPLQTRPGTFPLTGLHTPNSNSRRPRAYTSTTGSYQGPSSSPTPVLRSSMRSRASSVSVAGSSFMLPTTHELETEIVKERSSFPEDSLRIPGEFPPPILTSSPSDPAAYPSPPLTPLSMTFSASTSTSRSSSTPTSPVSASAPRAFSRLRSPSVTGEELPPRKASALAERYLSFLHLAPGVVELIGDGELVKVDEGGEEESVEEGGAHDTPTARSASDYSYSASVYAGNGYRIVGDAGAFIDPFFSSGIHLAMTGAISAAASICASIRGDCTEVEAARWFLVVVLSAYKQIRAQSTKVLMDIDDDNYDKAFINLRPVIQGSSEMGAKLSEDEVQRALDFCINLFNPTTPEQYDLVREKLSKIQLNEPASSDPPLGARDKDKDKDAECESGAVPGSLSLNSWMDVRAPIVSPSNLARMLRTRLRSLSGAGSASGSPPPSPSTGSFAGGIPPPLPPPATASLSRESSGSPTPLERVAEAEEGEQSKSKPRSNGGGGSTAEDTEMKMVLDKVNARRVIHADHMEGLNSLEQEDLEGFVVRLVRGRLGLVRT